MSTLVDWEIAGVFFKMFSLGPLRKSVVNPALSNDSNAGGT